jgi:hypothetical protein
MKWESEKVSVLRLLTSLQDRQWRHNYTYLTNKEAEAVEGDLPKIATFAVKPESVAIYL